MARPKTNSPQKMAIDERRQKIIAMHLMCIPHHEIIKRLGLTPGNAGHAMISKDIAASRAELKAEKLDDMATAKANQLAKIGQLRYEAYMAYERSCKQATTTRDWKLMGFRKSSKDEDDAVKELEILQQEYEKTTELRDGNPAFLHLILQCIREENEILGFGNVALQDSTSPPVISFVVNTSQPIESKPAPTTIIDVTPTEPNDAMDN